MKKLVTMLLCIVLLMVLVSCSGAEREPTEVEFEKIQEIFSNICSVLQTEEEIPLPTIKVVSGKKIEKLGGNPGSAAFYETDSHIVYLTDLNDETYESAVAHEMVHYLNHYLSNFSNLYGFDYLDSEIECGYYLTEGITQYIAEKAYPMPEGYAAYPFELMIVQQLVVLIDEQALIESFLRSDIETFKNAFNTIAYEAEFEDTTGDDGVERTPFEGFVLLLDGYSSCFLAGDPWGYAHYSNYTLSMIAIMAEQESKRDHFDSIYDDFMGKYGKTFWFLN